MSRYPENEERGPKSKSVGERFFPILYIAARFEGRARRKSSKGIVFGKGSRFDRGLVIELLSDEEPPDQMG